MRNDDVEFGGRVFVVAEVGSNHNGDFAIARQLVLDAASAGADAVKFQVYRGEKLVSPNLPVMSHVKGQHQTQRERFKSLEFSVSQWAELAELARSQGVLFFASVFDEESADAMNPFVPAFKIASGDLTHLSLLRHVANMGKLIILSTGMATVEEIASALEILPRDQVILLHCVSRYPTSPEEVNLRAIPFLAERFGVPVGYSDHTIGSTVCLGAVALGSVVIEKHFTFDKNQPLGDHSLSADAKEFAELVCAIRIVEKALGRYEKVPGEQERNMRLYLRRSLHVSRDVPAGTILDESCLMALRPGDGISPVKRNEIVGKRTKAFLPAWHKLSLTDLEL